MSSRSAACWRRKSTACRSLPSSATSGTRCRSPARARSGRRGPRPRARGAPACRRAARRRGRRRRARPAPPRRRAPASPRRPPAARARRRATPAAPPARRRPAEPRGRPSPAAFCAPSYSPPLARSSMATSPIGETVAAGAKPELRGGGVDPRELGVEPLQHALEHPVVLAVEAVDLVQRAAPGVLEVQLHVAGLGARREPEAGDQRQLLHRDARRELRPAASLDEGGRLARDLEARVAQGARQVGADPAGRRPHGALGVEDDAAAHGALDVGAGVVRRRVHGRRVDGRRVHAEAS